MVFYYLYKVADLPFLGDHKVKFLVSPAQNFAFAEISCHRCCNFLRLFPCRSFLKRPRNSPTSQLESYSPLLLSSSQFYWSLYLVGKSRWVSLFFCCLKMHMISHTNGACLLNRWILTDKICTPYFLILFNTIVSSLPYMPSCHNFTYRSLNIRVLNVD